MQDSHRNPKLRAAIPFVILHIMDECEISRSVVKNSFSGEITRRENFSPDASVRSKCEDIFFMLYTKILHTTDFYQV